MENYFKKEDERGKYWTNALTGAGTRKGESGLPWHGYSPTAVGRHWAVPGRIAEELGLDDLLSTQGKLDALDAAGFVVHPGADSGAMPTYRQYLADSPGVPLQDLWTYQPHTRGVLYGNDEGIDEDVRWLVAQGDTERLGYQTQKPEGILKRIVESACPPDGVVLDPFCGCGTAIAVAHRLGRPWIGIDITQAAIVVIKKRLTDTFGADVKFTVRGEPVTLPDARALADQDRYQFQWWALGLVNARPLEEKKGADKGIDGRIYFHDEVSGPTKSIVISVKSGAVGADDVRDLRAVLERERAQVGVLITLEKPTKPMNEEAIEAGFYTSSWGKHRKLQILTIEELLAGKGIDYPPTKANVTFKKAPRARAKEAKNLDLQLVAEPAEAYRAAPPARKKRSDPDQGE